MERHLQRPAGKAAKLQRKLIEKVAEHRRQDRLDRQRPERQGDPTQQQQQEKTARLKSLQRLRQKADRISLFLEKEEPKEGARGSEVQSNLTDNDSAKMHTSHGTIQGYNAQALVDGKKQIIVCGEASGVGQDHRQIAPILDAAQALLTLNGLNGLNGLSAGPEPQLTLAGAQLTADCNYHSEENLIACEAHQVEATIPDNHFRQRDPRLAGQEKHKAPFRSDHTQDPQARYAPKKNFYGLEHFTYQAEHDTYLCPAQKELTCQSQSHSTGDGHHYKRYRSKARDCRPCFRPTCERGLRPIKLSAFALAVRRLPSKRTMHRPRRRAQIPGCADQRCARHPHRADAAKDRHPRSQETLRQTRGHRRTRLWQP